MTISFDHADESANAAPCAQCGQRMADHYWAWQGRAICGACRDVLSSVVAKGKSKKAFVSASLRGGVVALGCGLAYALFVYLTNFQLSIITIGIGIVVAKAVRASSLGVGGRRYQVLAVALTYAASTMAYAPAIASAFKTAIQSESAQSAPAAPEVAQSSAAAASGAQVAFAVATLVFGFLRVMLTAPFLELTEAPLGLLIVGIGLWQAWKLTGGLPASPEGPFPLSTAGRSAS